MIWDTKAETMPREQMHALQSERLVDCVKRVYENVAPYRAKMDAAGVKPGDIRSIDDIVKLPFLTKQDLRDNYPYGLFACPMDDVVRIHASSGTTGKQVVVGYTEADLDIWAEVMARTLTAAGATNKDIAHISYGYSMFTGGLGAHCGAERIGAATIPMSVGNTKRQIQVLQDFGSTIICCTPSYALYLAETMEEMGVDPSSIHLKYGCFGAEPWTEEMRAQIESRLHLSAHDIYGLSEVMGPGVSFECDCKNGLHVNEDHFYPEIIDPDTLKPVPYGTPGELVFTCLTKQALPLIRYRTRDIAILNPEKCDCGRTTVRMSKPKGRTDDMLIIRGVNVFPSQVESVLLKFAHVAPHYVLVVDRVDTLDTLEIMVEMSPEFFTDEVRGIEALEKKIRREVESVLGISAKIRLVEPKTLERTEGKSKHVIDKRK